jgi:hypothetical protein
MAWWDSLPSSPQKASSGSAPWWERSASAPTAPQSDDVAPDRANNATPTPDKDSGGHGFLDTLKNMGPRDWAAEAVRLGGGYLAGIPSAVPGIGTAIGAGVGGGSEALAELIAGKGYDPTSIGVAAGVGAIPLGKIFKTGSDLATMGLNAARGAGLNVGVDVASKVAHGEAPESWRDEILPALIGGAGGGGATALHRFFGGGAAEVPPAGDFDRVGGSAAANAAPAGVPGPTWPTGTPDAGALQAARSQIRDPELQRIFDTAYGTREPSGPTLRGATRPYETGGEADEVAPIRPPGPGGEDLGDVNDKGDLERQIADLLERSRHSPYDVGSEGDETPHPPQPTPFGEDTGDVNDFGRGAAEPPGPAPRPWWETVNERPFDTASEADEGSPIRPPGPGGEDLGDVNDSTAPPRAPATVPGNVVPFKKATPIVPSEPSGPSQPTNIDSILNFLGMKPAAADALETLDPRTATNNASGESAASLEALRRQEGMQDRGEKFVVYDRGGNRRELLGPDAVDYRVRPGETYGIEGPGGFRLLDDAGGQPPTPGAAPPPVGEPRPAPPGPTHELAGGDDLAALRDFFEGGGDRPAAGEPPAATGEAEPAAATEEPSAASRFFDPTAHTFASPRFDPLAPPEVRAAHGGEFTPPTSPADVPASPEDRLRMVMGDTAANDILGRGIWKSRESGKDFVRAKDLERYKGGGKPTYSPEQLQAYKFLWNKERKAMLALDALAEKGGAGAGGDDTGGERGAVSTSALVPLATTLAGAAAGPWLEPDNKKLGVAGGAGFGLLAGLAMHNPALLNRLRYSNILSYLSVPKKLGGDLGELMYTMAEHPDKAGPLARNVFTRGTWDAAKEGFVRPTDQALIERAGLGRQGDLFNADGESGEPAYKPRGTYNPLELSGRALSGITEGAQSIYERAGFSPEEADERTFVNKPLSDTGEWAAQGLKKPLVNFLLPVGKVMTNILERSVSRTPGVATMPSVRAFSGLSPEAARRASAITALAMLGAGGAGYASAKGGPLEDYSKEIDAAPLLTGGAMVPVGAALGAGRALGTYGGGPADALAALAAGFAKGLPLPHGFEPSDLSGERAKATLARVLSQYLPLGGVGKLTSPIDPADFDTTGTLFGPSAAEIPMANELLLHEKRKPTPRVGFARPKR